ncbi:MAG TPA: hypothetical protein VLG46_17160 [Anaerolineae bacterium]|nr:hypothetical protein [Anaerolineae bacterium]
MQSSFSGESSDPTATNQALCADLSLLFTTFTLRLVEVIAHTGGRPLADQFTQQLNRYATQHGWTALTGLTDLSELNRRIPDVNAKMLASVYLSYTQYAQSLARQILGEQLLKSTLVNLLANLPARMVQLNAQYEIIRSA